jgi:hypothetical protein
LEETIADKFPITLCAVNIISLPFGDMAKSLTFGKSLVISAKNSSGVSCEKQHIEIRKVPKK